MENFFRLSDLTVSPSLTTLEKSQLLALSFNYTGIFPQKKRLRPCDRCMRQKRTFRHCKSYFRREGPGQPKYFTWTKVETGRTIRTSVSDSPRRKFVNINICRKTFQRRQVSRVHLVFVPLLVVLMINIESHKYYESS